MHIGYRVLLSLLLLTNLLPAFGAVPGTNADDRLLSRLRGTWEYRTYADVRRIEFISDDQVWFNQTLSHYQINSTELVISYNGIATQYAYRLSDEALELTYPDGTIIRFKNDAPGESEEKLDGRFYAVLDSIMEASISFQNGRDFVVSTRFDTAVAENDLMQLRGVYRIVDDRIIFSFDDGTIDQATIRFWDSEENPDGILYHGYLFDKEQKLIVTLPYYPRPIIPYFPPPELPFPPPCLSCPSPGPVLPPNPPPAGGSIELPSPGNNHQNGDRTIGSHRSTVDDSQSSGNRTEGHRRGSVRP